MSQSVSSFKFNKVEIISSTGKRLDLTNNILFMDYFEDILSPCITMQMQIAATNSIFNGLPIRGGEKILIDVTTSTGNFILDEEYAMYVYKVSNLVSDGVKESFTLHLVSREGLTNETARCQRKYQKLPINEHVTSILKDVLRTEKFSNESIERTSNSFSFIGNQKKPFHILTWLCPKGIPSNTNSGENGTEAKGVSGFLFYETKDGFNFKSIEGLVSQTTSTQELDSLVTYTFSNAIEEGKAENNFIILNYDIQKNVDLMKTLRVGTYANKTYFYDLYTNTLDLYDYDLKREIKSKLGEQDDLDIPEQFQGAYSRILIRTSDRGTLDPNDLTATSGRDNSDMAKSFSRYNILFTQTLNMMVPCNVRLRAGGIIKAVFPKTEAAKTSNSDNEQSGKYLIKELRHHFEVNRMVTSLKLVRDSYGLY